jgi:DNA-directed RNA polymerase subunit N (RpoN/RPB10)
MKTEQVRCWMTGSSNELFITYPEGDMGHRLICCTSCGKVYAVNVLKQLYIEPDLDVQLSHMKCITCGESLFHNWHYYPDKYLGADGKLKSFERSIVIPPDSESIIEEFPEIFSQ